MFVSFNFFYNFFNKYKKNEEKNATHDRWHVTGYTWHMVWGEHSLKISASFGSPDFTHNRSSHFSCVCLCQTYHSCYKDSPVYVALNLTWKVMLSHSAHWLCNLSTTLILLCIHSLHILKFFVVGFSMKPSDFESFGQRVFADWRSSTL